VFVCWYQERKIQDIPWEKCLKIFRSHKIKERSSCTKPKKRGRLQINAAVDFLGVFPLGPAALNKALLLGRGAIAGAERLLGRGFDFIGSSGGEAGAAISFALGVERAAESREGARTDNVARIDDAEAGRAGVRA